ncbi:MAG TPA: hypothetical protein DCZ75_10710 [Geobacter sp.]|nr:hypothetical protein [Geobacter sp.]
MKLTSTLLTYDKLTSIVTLLIGIPRRYGEDSIAVLAEQRLATQKNTLTRPSATLSRRARGIGWVEVRGSAEV